MNSRCPTCGSTVQEWISDFGKSTYEALPVNNLSELERAVVEAADELCPPDGHTFPIVFAKLEKLTAAMESLRAARAAQGRAE